jgi:hypothetical protein
MGTHYPKNLGPYKKRITGQIAHEMPVLIGVSGGILVQEMARHIKVRKVIIISSVRSNAEFPIDSN